MSTSTWTPLDQGTIGYQQGFYRDPLDTPILWDAKRNFIFAKNVVFNAANLSEVEFTFSTPSDAVLIGAYQNAYAIDPSRGLMVTRHDVFSNDTFMSVGSVANSSAAQYFVSSGGLLRELTSDGGQLACEALP